ncbi:MAG TPA: DUF3795 domain-containing protein [Clostridia bacterium]|nr:DUF3795 domain-containing protein [Clostridia bacterium]
MKDVGKNAEISVCGLICSDCKYFKNKCNGCRMEKGKIFWTGMFKLDVCTIYSCTEQKGYDTCGQCGDLPCCLFDDLKDPRMSDEEHQRELDVRVGRLKSGGKPI